MNSKVLFIGLFTLHAYAVSGQTLERQVINSFGNAVTVSGVYYEQNAGEVLTQTYQGGGYWLLQGFIQPVNVVIGMEEYDTEAEQACPELYPNPFQTKVYFNELVREVKVAWLVEATGKRVWQMENPGREIILPEDLSEGFYLLILEDSRQQQVCRYRLVHYKF